MFGTHCSVLVALVTQHDALADDGWNFRVHSNWKMALIRTAHEAFGFHFVHYDLTPCTYVPGINSCFVVAKRTLDDDDLYDRQFFDISDATRLVQDVPINLLTAL